MVDLRESIRLGTTTPAGPRTAQPAWRVSAGVSEVRAQASLMSNLMVRFSTEVTVTLTVIVFPLALTVQS